MTWSILNASSWLEASPSQGALATGATTNVKVSLTAAAADLDDGTYLAVVTFTNWNSQVAQSVPFTLQVSQSLVQNGGFETGDFTGWTLVGDTTSAGTIYNDVQSSTVYPSLAHSGNYFAFLGDTQLATLSQTLATVPGANYLLSFWLDNPTNGAPEAFLVNWIVSGAVTNTLYDVTSPPVLAWTNLQYFVTASSPNTVLQFGAQNGPFGFGLDDVSVTPSFQLPTTIWWRVKICCE